MVMTSLKQGPHTPRISRNAHPSIPEPSKFGTRPPSGEQRSIGGIDNLSEMSRDGRARPVSTTGGRGGKQVWLDTWLGKDRGEVRVGDDVGGLVGGPNRGHRTVAAQRASRQQVGHRAL